MATGYQIYQITGLLLDLRDFLDPELIERVSRQLPSMSNSQANGIAQLLMDYKKEMEHG